MQKLFGRLRFEVKVGEKNLHQHQAFKFKFPENHEKYEGRRHSRLIQPHKPIIHNSWFCLFQIMMRL